MTTLSRESVEWSVDHLARHLDTDIFPKAFEIQAMSHSKQEVVDYLGKKDICQWTTRPLRKCLTPKHRYGFRVATQLDPLDMVFYTALILEIGEELERSRIPAGDRISFSSRFKIEADFRLFEKTVGYPEFQAHSRELAGRYPHIVLTDIADFYPRIYLHRLENALDAKLPGHATHAKAIVRLLKSWNQHVSYGIPVGNNPSRLLAELVIDDVDRALLSEGIVFARYVDDYRIFCRSSQEAYQGLARLANLLYEMHGLTLQAEKTQIMPSERFLKDILESERRKELKALEESFGAILEGLGIDDPYQIVEYADLPPEVKRAVDAMNLCGLLTEEIKHEEPDMALIKMLINRIGWLKVADPVWEILHNLEKLHPAIAEIVRFLARLKDGIPKDERARVGAFLLDKLEGSVISTLEYHRMQVMGLFAGSGAWGNGEKLARYYMGASDDWLRRTVVLALGKAGQDYWIRSKKSQVEQLSPWEKRSLLYAASCLPADEKKHWYSAIRARLDHLEQWVVKWAQDAPINVEKV
jgi:hypothetical protein